MRTSFYAYVDESGVRKHGPKTSQHFVMSAVILPGSQKAPLLMTLAQLLRDLGMAIGRTIQFKELSHQSRLRVSQVIAAVGYLRITNVIVCKRHLQLQMADVDGAYLLTLRYLLERISWHVDDRGGQAYVTFAHIDRFKIAKLHAYIAVLQNSNTEIRWPALHLPMRMETMQANDFLQVADATASATAQGFEPDRFGNTEDRYIRSLAPRLYRRLGGRITSYGMKLHPTSAASLAEYAWVATL